MLRSPHSHPPPEGLKGEEPRLGSLALEPGRLRPHSQGQGEGGSLSRWVCHPLPEGKPADTQACQPAPPLTPLRSWHLILFLLDCLSSCGQSRDRGTCGWQALRCGFLEQALPASIQGPPGVPGF